MSTHSYALISSAYLGAAVASASDDELGILNFCGKFQFAPLTCDACPVPDELHSQQKKV
jgi:hypothetical protein